jgi:hypothetical protein
VIERIEGLPGGVLGFRASGKLSRDEYQQQLMPPIYEALERGEQLNLLFEFADDFSGLELNALWEDVKAAGSVGLKHRKAWGRMALITDKDWIRHGVSAFGWLSPGELRVFEPGQREPATAWVAGSVDG